MTWARFDDKRALNAKLRAVGFEARGLDDAAICMAAGDESDGFVSDQSVEMLCVAHGSRNARKLTAALVRVGRWERDDGRGGWWIHDYLEYNPSHDELEEGRARTHEVRSKAGRIGGLRSGVTRRSKLEANDEANVKQNASSFASKQTKQNEAKRSPVPSRLSQSQSPGFTDTPDSARTGGNGDRIPENRQINGNGQASQLQRLVAVCTADRRDTVQLEAVAVINWARTHLDQAIIDEAIGFLEHAPNPPTLPRAAAVVIAQKAADHGINMPGFAVIGRAAE